MGRGVSSSGGSIYGGDNGVLKRGRGGCRSRESRINLGVARPVLRIRIGVMAVLGSVGIRRRGERQSGSRSSLRGLWSMFPIVLLQFCPCGAELRAQCCHFVPVRVQNRMCEHIRLIVRASALYEPQNA